MTKKTQEKTPVPDAKIPLFVIGVGASAGGLEAFKALLPELPVGKNIAYVLLQHQDRAYSSALGKLLEKYATCPVLDISQNLPLQGGAIYICPPGQQCAVTKNGFKLDELQETGPRHSIDTLFSSLADNFHEFCAGIILSGTGKDGVLGMRAIKAAEGWTFAQAPATAEFPSMPKAVIDNFLADIIRPPSGIGTELATIIRFQSNPLPELPLASNAELLHTLLEVVENETGFDIRRYKETMLARRISRRLAANKIKSLDDYLLLLKNSKSEALSLIKDIFITVTSFFRDQEVFDYLEKLLHELVKKKTPGDTIRIWSAGCATGEEAYSIAMLLAEILETSGISLAVKIFATDIDPDNIKFARKGIYPARLLENVPPAYIEKYFSKTDGYYQIDNEIRESVIFAKHDITIDAPFSQLDLICCRNLLIYFNSFTQLRLIERLHNSLKPDAYLVLGISETIGKADSLFKTVDRQLKIFQKAKNQTAAARFPVSPQKSRTIESPAPLNPLQPREIPPQQQMQELYFAEFAPAAVLLNSRLELLHVHGDVHSFLRLQEGDTKLNILSLCIPELKQDLQLVLQQAQRSKKIVRSRPVKLPASDSRHEKKSVSLAAIPQISNIQPDKSPAKILLVFEERTQPQASSQNIEESAEPNHILEVMEELNATRNQLVASIELQESSRQELQSINEEFLSTTEELQSSNEEFQTANEELQSTNEELISVNEELRTRTAELASTNSELDYILNTTISGIIVIDRNLQITRYSDNCENMFSLWPAKVSNIQQFLATLFSQDVITPKIHQTLSSGIASKVNLAIGANNFLIRLIPVVEKADETVNKLIIAFYDETEQRKLELEARLLAAVVKNSKDSIIVHGLDGKILNWNLGAQVMFGYSEEEALTLNIDQLIPHDLQTTYHHYIQQLALPNPVVAHETKGLGKTGKLLDIWSTGGMQYDHSGKATSVAVIFRDITEKNVSEDQLNTLVESIPDAIIIVSNDGKIQRINKQAETFFGYSREQLLGQAYSMLIPSRFREQHKSYHKSYLKNPLMRNMGENKDLYCLSSAGEEMPVDIGLSPMLIRDNSSTLLVIRDIRQVKLDQQLLMAEKSRANQANLTKSRFLAAASHDLRQPLQAIGMYLGVLAEKINNDQKQKTVEQAKLALDSTNKMLNSLLNISKLEAGKVQPDIKPVFISDVIARVTNNVMLQAKTKSQQLSMSKSRALIVTDLSLLEELLTNLVTNAVKYTPVGGKIAVKCEKVGKQLCIRVSDTGPGIAAENLGNIFDEYKRLDYDRHYVGQSVGLGLSIVKLIANLLDLKLEVLSLPGAGTTFTVLVPLADSQAKEPVGNPENPPGKLAFHGHLLLVEDDEAVAASTKLFLELSGLKVMAASKSVDALALAVEQTPALILSDYGLAENMTGIQLIEAIRKSCQAKIPAIVITGDTSDRRKAEAASSDCEIVCKPVDTGALLHLIHKLMKSSPIQ